MLSAALSNKNRLLALCIMAAAVMFVLSACAPYHAVRVPTGHKEKGEASWYGPGFAGKKTASGERYNPKELTAAHKSLPFGTEVQVTNLDNHKSVIVTINDRGPFVRGRIIDLSKGAAKKLGVYATGTAEVELAVLGPREKKRSKIDAGSEDDGEESDLIKDASAAETSEEIAAAGEEKTSDGMLLAANKHYKSKGKASEKPVTRNGVAYLIEKDDAVNGGESIDNDLEKVDKKSRHHKAEPDNSKAFKKITKNEGLDDDAEVTSPAKSIKDADDIEEDLAPEVKVKRHAASDNADDKIEEALKKIDEKRAARIAEKEIPKGTKQTAKPAEKPAIVRPEPEEPAHATPPPEDF